MFLGIDLGTSSVKAMLLDEAGSTLATARSGYAVATTPDGHAESDTRAWLAAVDDAIAALPANARATVRAIGFSGQMHGVVLCDQAGEALRPAVLWMDRRGAKVLGDFPADTPARTGNWPSAGMAAATLAWLTRHEPDVMARARWALQPKDWLRLRLGGDARTDPSDATGTLLAGPQGAWDTALVSALNLNAGLLPPIAASHSCGGVLDAQVARRWGMPAGAALVTGAADTAAAALGAGLLHDGDAQLTTGTGGQIVVLRAACPSAVHGLNVFRSAGPPGLAQWYAMAAMQNVGVALEWARAVLGLDWSRAYAALRDAPVTQACFLPYLTGERTPLMNAGARGAWIGLSTADDGMTLMRAAFEGVAFSLRAGWETLTRAGHAVHQLQLAGGGSTHPAWSQLLADTLGVALFPADVPDASARGAALLAGVGAGHWNAHALPAIELSNRPVEPSSMASELVARYADFTRHSAYLAA